MIENKKNRIIKSPQYKKTRTFKTYSVLFIKDIKKLNLNYIGTVRGELLHVLRKCL